MGTTVFKRFYQVLIPSLFILFIWGFPAGSIEQTQVLAESAPWSCLFFKITGFLCPGCGMTRALISFFALAWMQSFIFNPFGPFIGLFLVGLWMSSFLFKEFSFETFLNALAQKFPRRAWLSAVVVLVVWGVLRNSLDFF